MQILPRFIGAVLGLLCALAILLFAGLVDAQTQCRARDALVYAIQMRHFEVPIGGGVAGTKLVYELYVSAKGSWTMIRTGTDGISCIVAVGDSWYRIPADITDGPEL